MDSPTSPSLPLPPLDPLFTALLRGGLADVLGELESLEVEVASWTRNGVPSPAAARVLLGLERLYALLRGLGEDAVDVSPPPVT